MEIFLDFQCNLVASGSIQKKWLARPGFSIINGSQVRIFVYRPEFKNFLCETELIIATTSCFAV